MPFFYIFCSYWIVAIKIACLHNSIFIASSYLFILHRIQIHIKQRPNQLKRMFFQKLASNLLWDHEYFLVQLIIEWLSRIFQVIPALLSAHPRGWHMLWKWTKLHFEWTFSISVWCLFNLMIILNLKNIRIVDWIECSRWTFIWYLRNHDIASATAKRSTALKQSKILNEFFRFVQSAIYLKSDNARVTRALFLCQLVLWMRR